MTRRSLKHFGIGIVLAALTSLGSPAWAATPDEQARDLFRAQRYSEALVIYERMRAESHHPTYLRNIGRCHQMMRQPTPAIAAFEGYLREAPALRAEERVEVEGYIAEMRRLEAGGTRLPNAGPASASPGVVPVAAPPSAPNPLVAPEPPASAPALVVATGAPADTDGGSSIVRKWWFWAGIGALVVASGIIIAVNSGDERLPCPGGAVCP